MYSQPLISRFQRGVGWGRILWGRAKGVLNAAADFKISERRIRRDGHRILPDRGRSEHCDCHRRQRHRQHPQHQIHLGQYFAEIAACDLSAFSARIAAIRANMRVAAGWRGVVLPPDRHLPARLLELFREFTTSSATRRGTGSEVSCLAKKADVAAVALSGLFRSGGRASRFFGLPGCLGLGFFLRNTLAADRQ
jgi:hypothetical protein